jgi:hypothetical protein
MHDRLIPLLNFESAAAAETLRAILEANGFRSQVVERTRRLKVCHVLLVHQEAAVAAAEFLQAAHIRTDAQEGGGDFADRCLQCSAPLPENDDICTACGWSYRN